MRLPCVQRLSAAELREELGIKPRKLERVNVAARMQELGLDQMFNPESWPAAPPLRELCTKVKNLTGEGFSNPFVFAELHK